MKQTEAYILARSFWGLGFGALIVAPVSFRAWQDWSVYAFRQLSPLGFNRALEWANKLWKAEIWKDTKLIA